MTTVFDYSKDYGLTASGHACAGRPGEDLVCCAVSTLMYTLAEALGKEDIICFTKIRDGFFDVYATPKLTQRDTASLIFKTILSGIEHLAMQYPEHINIKKEV